jgi:hypothetical protein
VNASHKAFTLPLKTAKRYVEQLLVLLRVLRKKKLKHHLWSKCKVFHMLKQTAQKPMRFKEMGSFTVLTTIISGGAVGLGTALQAGRPRV